MIMRTEANENGKFTSNNRKVEISPKKREKASNSLSCRKVCQQEKKKKKETKT